MKFTMIKQKRFPHKMKMGKTRRDATVSHKRMKVYIKIISNELLFLIG